jgi:hypothetical protein
MIVGASISFVATNFLHLIHQFIDLILVMGQFNPECLIFFLKQNSSILLLFLLLLFLENVRVIFGCCFVVESEDDFCFKFVDLDGVIPEYGLERD